jgi:UDP-2-acetamido-3-amino-2,3-dideoxy-glucuronate N-acetyltransferase
MPEAIHAQGGNYLHDQLADVTVTLLSFPSGVRAHVFVSWLHPFKEQKLVIVGTRKMAVFDDLEPHDKLLLYPHSIEWKGQIPVANRAEAQRVAVEAGEPLRAECAHFIDCVATRRAPRTDGREATRVLSVLEACDRALRGGGTGGPRQVAAAPAAAQRPYFVHESAYVDEGVQIGEGTTVWHFSHILRDSRVGRNVRIGQNVVVGPRVSVGDGVKIQNNVSVYEGVTLEEHVFCGPSVVFTNVINPRSEIRRMEELRPTLVRRGATLGANSTVVCGVTIGEYAFVGAGAVVVKDVPDHALVVGNPARTIGWMCACGHRLSFDPNKGAGTCLVCQRAYRAREGAGWAA